MSVEWEPKGPGYVYVMLADYLQSRIESGDLPKGARLPGEQELAEEYQVAIGTARKATALLRERGLVETFPSKGTYVL